MSIQAFRSEIVNTVKTLHELNKIKIVLVAGILAVAFGVGSTSKIGDYSYLTLAIVPFICLYVDFQYYHGLAKIFVLAKFLSEVRLVSEEVQLVQSYESYVHRIRQRAAPGLFSFESKAQIGSSIFLSIVCPHLGMVALLTTPTPGTRDASWIAMLAILALASYVGTIIVWFSYRAYCREIEAMGKIPVSDHDVEPHAKGDG